MNVEVFGVEVELDETAVAESPAEIRRQVAAYERGDLTAFDLTVTVPEGLTGDVMDRMRRIPYGETRTYGDVAAELDTAAVAVGQACGRNPVPLVVPCHRIVGSDSLGGFSAGGERALDLKARLLAHERASP
ncbi:methylated-DNA--[protein]-cysteine S-methyltransferase [Halegenticoccus tardaugens]|uniref:methylated-DNA--[protein]-cysteine S-methyltransferase n=1 Tax=Halegenticoccus tardaugens TaxID=2071624 RepID=UPI00100BA14B|nr:methylated-DNA--[protein]-cysteine S-methyltransferase [Halegenticoccus tardaugens]